MENLQDLQELLEILEKQEQMMELLEKQQDEITILERQLSEQGQELLESREALDESMCLNENLTRENRNLTESLKISVEQNQRLQTQIGKLKSLHE